MSTMILLAFKAILCQILCQFCDCCDDSEDCPDGICDPLRDAVIDLESTGGPGLTAKPTTRSWKIDWAKLQEAIPAIVAAVKAITNIFK